MKWFVSCILPGVKRLGAMQFEAEDEPAAVKIAEEMAPCRGVFQSWEMSEFEDGMRVGVFVDQEGMIELGY